MIVETFSPVTPEADIHWDSLDLFQRSQLTMKLGWITNKGYLTRLGRFIAQSNYEQQSLCVKEIFKRHNISQ